MLVPSRVVEEVEHAAVAHIDGIIVKDDQVVIEEQVAVDDLVVIEDPAEIAIEDDLDLEHILEKDSN